jgi:large subunit ribosomal protein L25
MKAFVLSGSPRVGVGKKDAKKLRHNDEIPCVLYGGKDQLFFSVTFNNVRNLVYSPDVYKVEIQVDGQSRHAVMQEIQTHPVTDKLLHIDFLELVEDKPVVIEIPVRTIGTSAGARQGGKLITNVRKLKIRALPKHLPDFVEVNVEPLEIGQAIKIGQLSLDGVTFLDAPNVVICAVRMTRAAASAATAASETGKK